MLCPSQFSEIRLVIVDGETLVREAMAHVFANARDCRVLGTAARFDELPLEASRDANILLLHFDTLKPTVRDDGVALAHCTDQLRIVGFDDDVKDMSLRRTLRLGWFGYLTKRDSVAEMLRIVWSAASGVQAFSKRSQFRLLATNYGWELLPSNDAPGLHLLTTRETEVLVRICQGDGARRCSEQLQIAVSTVENHKARIMKKLKVRNSIELVRFAMREGLVL